MKLILEFALRNETPGALRYEETDKDGKVVSIKDGAKIGTLYVRKTTYPNGKPSKLLVTMEDR